MIALNNSQNVQMPGYAGVLKKEKQSNSNPHPETQLNKEVKQQGFNPYVDNGGSVIAIGGPQFCIIASDTRISEGYSIVSRNTSKICQLGENTFLSSSGMYADFTALKKNLQNRLQMYEYQMDRKASTKAIGNLLSYTLYMKRFFPFYTFNALAGLDENGDGMVYGYDAIGSFDRLPFVVQGSGQSLILPIIDNQLEGYNKINKNKPATIEEMLDLVADCFTAAAERDIYTGDNAEVILIQPNKPIQTFNYPLRQD